MKLYAVFQFPIGKEKLYELIALFLYCIWDAVSYTHLFQIIKMPVLQALMRKTVSFKLLCSLQKKNFQTYIILLTSAYANRPLTVIAECSAVKP